MIATTMSSSINGESGLTTARSRQTHAPIRCKPNAILSVALSFGGFFDSLRSLPKNKHSRFVHSAGQLSPPVTDWSQALKDLPTES